MIVLMIVIAMLVVVMVLAMMMVVMTVRRMVMRAVMRMHLRRVGMAAAGIGAAFGIERRLDLDDARPQPLHHRLDDVIAPDSQAFWHDLGRQMAVAEMPGDANQMLRIGPSNFQQRLRRRYDFDQPAVIEHQCVAAAQRDRVFQVEQEFKSPRARHRHPPPVPIVEIEYDGIGGRFRPTMLSQDAGGADHG